MSKRPTLSKACAFVLVPAVLMLGCGGKPKVEPAPGPEVGLRVHDPGDQQQPAKEQSKRGAAPQKHRPKFTIGKDTTYVALPVENDGSIDYAAALNNRLSEGVTPANNANVLVCKALGPHPDGRKVPPEFFRLLGTEPPPELGGYFVDLVPYLKDHQQHPADKANDAMANQLERCSQRAWTALEHRGITGWLKANEKPLNLIVEASKRPRYYAPHGLPRTPQGSHCMLLDSNEYGLTMRRDLVRVLTARAMLRVGQGRLDDAWQDLLACHRLARLQARGGTLPDTLAGLANEGIASKADLGFLAGTRLSARQIENCGRDLQRLPAMPRLADVVDLGVRFELLDTTLWVARGGPPALEELSATRDSPPKVPERVWRPIWNTIDWDPALRSANRWIDRLVSAMRVEDRVEREKQLDAWGADLQALRKSVIEGGDVTEALKEKVFDKALAQALGMTVGDMVPLLTAASLPKVQLAADRTRQVQDNLQVALALAAYRRDRGGYPKTLDALVPRYVVKVPGDMFSGKALVYRPSSDGYLLYSVGVNGKDEQGRGPEDEPPGDDLSVRMPLPKWPPRVERRTHSPQARGSAAKDKDRLQGTWLVVSSEMGGKPMTKEDIAGKMTYKFDGNVVTVSAVGAVLGASKFKLNPAKKPKRIDFDAGSLGTNPGIYELDGDKLKICMDVPDGVRPTKFKTKVGTYQKLFIFKRKKPAN